MTHPTWIASFLVACGGTSDPCAAYADSPALHASCVVHGATEAARFVDAHCDQADALEPYCREVWIRAHAEQAQEDLLAACDDPECRFFAADTHPSAYPQQLVLCATLRQYGSQCVGHATARFLGGHPDVAAQRVAFASAALWASVVGRQVGSYMRCGGVSDCSVVPGGELDCAAANASAPDPSICASFRPDFPDPGEATISGPSSPVRPTAPPVQR